MYFKQLPSMFFSLWLDRAKRSFELAQLLVMTFYALSRTRCYRFSRTILNYARMLGPSLSGKQTGGFPISLPESVLT